MDSSKQGYINYRIEKAKEVLQDAQILINEERWNSAVNRLYYASFHAVQALLLSNNLSAKTHNGTKSLFFQYFIKTGLLNKEFSKLFSDLQDWRQEEDYANFIQFDKETVKPLAK